MLNVTFQRAYKEGEARKNSTSFGQNNLLLLSLLAARALEWITAESKAGKRAQPSLGWRLKGCQPL